MGCGFFMESGGLKVKAQGRSQDFLRGGAQFFNFCKINCNMSFVLNISISWDNKIDFLKSLQHFLSKKINFLILNIKII